MFRLSLKNVLARKGRLALTALAIIAGTTFLSGVFVFSDTIRGTFDTIFANAYAKTDAFVRSTNKVDAGFSTTRDQIPDSLIATVRRRPGRHHRRRRRAGLRPDEHVERARRWAAAGRRRSAACSTGSPISPWDLAEGTRRVRRQRGGDRPRLGEAVRRRASATRSASPRRSARRSSPSSASPASPAATRPAGRRGRCSTCRPRRRSSTARRGWSTRSSSAATARSASRSSPTTSSRPCSKPAIRTSRCSPASRSPRRTRATSSAG